MKTRPVSFAVVLSAMSLTAAAEEYSWGEVAFQPRAYVGYADYNLKASDIQFVDLAGKVFTGLQMAYPKRSKIDFSGLLWGIGGTVSYKQFFGDIYYQSTASETVYSGFSEPGDPIRDNEGNVYNRLWSYGPVDAQHSDWAVSLGYSITDQWSVFAGYKSGKTDWDQSVTQDLNPPVPEYGTFNVLGLDAKFDQDGPFLGTSYSFPIGPGALTLKAAYAYLDGTYDWNQNGSFNKGSEFETPYTIHSKLTGNSNALSLGIAWAQALTDNLGYTLGANYHRYEFDMSGSTTAQTLAGEDIGSGEFKEATLTEDLFTLTATLFYRF